VNVTINAEIVIDSRFNPITAIGLVDFMAFQPDDAAIQYDGNIEEGSAFYEYSVTGWLTRLVAKYNVLDWMSKMRA
jgi:hypothetical protein